MPEYLTIDEVAERFRTSPGALYTQRHRGESPGALAVKVGSKLLWNVEDLEQWFDHERESQRVAVAS
jgi:hypothetical protein